MIFHDQQEHPMTSQEWWPRDAAQLHVLQHDLWEEKHVGPNFLRAVTYKEKEETHGGVWEVK